MQKPVIERLPFIGEDTRKRKYLLPERIVSVFGDVRQEKLLLKQKPLQVAVCETELTTLKSTPECHASVLLDFGQNLHGGARLMLGRLGQEDPEALEQRFPLIHLTFGESVSETLAAVGEKNATNDHSTRDMTVPLSFLSDQEFGQTGFRFLRVEVLTPGVEVNFKAILAVMIYRELSYEGSFECSDPLLNRIYDVAAYTCHLNIQSMVWDGFKRDRLVWIGDMHPETKTICSVFGKCETLEESLVFVRQNTPLTSWMNGIPSYSMWYIIILHELYRQNGACGVVMTDVEYTIAVLEKLAGLVNEDGTDTIPNYFLDWPSSNIPGQKTGVRCVLRLALKAGETLAMLYGKPETAKRAKVSREKLDRQTENPYALKTAAAFMALAGVRDAKRIAEENILPGGAKGLSTFLSYYVLKAVADGGHTQDALNLLRSYYGAMLSMGATTFWEDFNLDWLGNGAAPIDRPVLPDENDIHGDHGDYCYVGLRHSLSHGWSSGPVPFLAECVLGVEILEPGCRKLKIHPDLGGLLWAKGTYPTPYGKVNIYAEKTDDGVKCTVDAPEEVKIIK